MEKLKKVIQQLNEKDFTQIKSALEKNNSEKFLHVLVCYNDNSVSDEEIQSLQLAVIEDKADYQPYDGEGVEDALEEGFQFSVLGSQFSVLGSQFSEVRNGSIVHFDCHPMRGELKWVRGVEGS